jgi:hypothetical protein
LLSLTLCAVALLALPQRGATAAGEGIFELDKVEYSTPEGTAVLVTVKRTSGATLTVDVQVQLELEGGDPNVDYPASEQTKLVTFPKNTNLTQQSVFIQTLNQNRFESKDIFVTIRSVSNGGQIGPISSSKIRIIGTNEPQVLNVSPRSAGTDPQPPGGETIVITGVNFLQPGVSTTTRLSFLPANNILATPTPLGTCGTFTPVNNTQIILTLNLGPLPLVCGFITEGVAHHIIVTVKDPSNTEHNSRPDTVERKDLFYYTSGPTITQLSPKSGTVAGGTQLRITGRGFTGVPGALCSTVITHLLIGGTAVSNCVYEGPNTIVAITPPHPLGKVDVALTVGTKTSPATSDSEFEYTQGPTITGLSPSFGPPSGGNTIVIAGVNFILKDANLYDVPVSEVLFGGTPAASFVVESSTRIVATAPPGAGTVHVTLKHPLAGLSQFTTAANYGYSAGPLIASISPDSGPVVGGTVVTITGTGFLPGATVKFGANQATFATVVSPTRIDVTSPPGAGVVDVVVTVNANASPPGPQARFSYSGPTVESVSPIAGPLAGGGTVTIKGKNFNSQAVVQFGAVAVIPTYVDPQTLTAVVPASAIPQAVHVRVSTGSGLSPETSADLYTYTNGPIVDLVNPDNGPTTGGTIVIIIGKNFTAPLSVRFGDTPVEAFNLNSATQITVLSPPNGSPGPVDVRVTRGTDTSPTGPATKFTYNSAVPKITALTPNTGSTFGGNEVVITGIGFTGATCPGAVKFGTVQAPECKVINDTTMTAKAPPNVSGPAVVVVTTPNGSSEIVPNYTYVSPTGSGGGSTAPPPPSPGGTESYTLTSRWSLLTWTGRDGMSVNDAIRGTGVPGASDLSARITAIFQWDAPSSSWKAFFVGSDGVPGASDFSTMTTGAVYWVAISGEGTVPWVVPLG